MIVVVVVAVLLLGIVIGVYGQSVHSPAGLALSVPRFLSEPHCIFCDAEIIETNLGAQAWMNFRMVDGINVPVTVEICQECVSRA